MWFWTRKLSIARLAAFLLLILTGAHLATANEEVDWGKLVRKGVKQYLSGQYDQALDDFVKAQALRDKLDNRAGPKLHHGQHLFIGTIWAKKGDMQKAYHEWVLADYQTGPSWPPSDRRMTMRGISDPQVRLAAQILADELVLYESTGPDIDGDGTAAGDGLEILLRAQGFAADADTVARRAKLERQSANTAAKAGQVTFSDLLGAVGTGLAAGSAGAQQTAQRQADAGTPQLGEPQAAQQAAAARGAAQQVSSGNRAGPSQPSSGYVNALPNCGQEVYENDGALAIENKCNVAVTVFYTSLGDVWGGKPLSPGEHSRTAYDRAAVVRAGGIEVYTCPGNSTPVQPNGSELGYHYRGEYKCHP